MKSDAGCNPDSAVMGRWSGPISERTVTIDRLKAYGLTVKAGRLGNATLP